MKTSPAAVATPVAHLEGLPVIGTAVLINVGKDEVQEVIKTVRIGNKTEIG